jgi:hypothetical protein
MLEDWLVEEGFEEIDPIGESRVFVRGQIRFSVTRMPAAESWPRTDDHFFHAGLIGQDCYIYRYECLPEGKQALLQYIEKLEERLQEEV